MFIYYLLGLVLVLLFFYILGKVEKKKMADEVFERCSKPVIRRLRVSPYQLMQTTEMSIWVDRATINLYYPDFTESDFEALTKKLKQQMKRLDYLFMQGKGLTVLVVPELCTVSFGTGCFDYTSLHHSVDLVDHLNGSYVLMPAELHPKAEYLLTIGKH